MNLRSFTATLLLCIIHLIVSQIQLSAQEIDEANFTRYTKLQGLSNNFVAGIAQDNSGYIWIATHKGLNRFDGKSFQSIFKDNKDSPIPDNHLVSMRQQNSNEIIGATRAGAFSFNPLTGKYKQFIIPCDSTIYFWTNHALDIAKDIRNNYVISTKTGLYVFNQQGKIIRRYDYHCAADAGKTEMIFGGWVHEFSNGYTLQQNGLLGSLYNPYTNSIDTFYIAKKTLLKKVITDNNGDMKMAWCGKNNELFALNKNSNSIDIAGINSEEAVINTMPFNVKSELGWQSKINYLSDSLLIITCRSGFYVLHYSDKENKLTCDGKKYFSGIACTSVFKDREGRLWIGTTDGLYKQNMNNVFFSVKDIAVHAPDLIDREIRSIYADKNSIFTGLLNDGGLVVLDKKTNLIKKRIQLSPTSYSNTILNIFPYDTDTLWLGTSAGIVWLNKNNFTYGHLNLPTQPEWISKINTTCFMEDCHKNIWISFGNLNSVVYYERSTGKFHDISSANYPKLKITYVFSMAEDLFGNVWLAGDGLCRWNTTKKEIDTLIPYPKVSKLLRNYMLILGRDKKNNLWLSSYDNEIIQYNCSTNKMYLRQQENNLVDGNTITSSGIINDNIWMGTDNGITAFNINTFSIKQFTYADGLPSVAITSIRRGSFYDKAANQFYIAARHRLISFVPDVSLSHKIPPQLFVEKVILRDSAITPNGDDIYLRYRQNNLTILFNTINFTDPEENRFAWRLINSSDTSWRELNDQSSITLTNLPPGWNTIQVKLFSANNHWPPQSKELRMYIRPPFWKTVWFVGLLFLFITGSIFFIYKRRLNNVRKKERQKAQVQRLIAQEYKSRLELEQISNFFSTSLAGKNTIEEVLWDVTKNLIGRMNYEDCIIYMWNADKTKMIQKAAHGPKGNASIDDLSSFEVAPGQGLVGHVILTKESLLVADTRQDKRYRVDDMSRLSELSVPIIHDNELIGIIDSEHQNANHFQERDVKILTTIATLVANKIKQLESEQLLAVKQKEISFINQQLAEAQLAALQTQMNPHFIFNSLNSIKGMILNDEQQKASRYLSKFAHMIRLTLNQSKETFTTLYENIEHLESYLTMEKLRFDDSFNFELTVDEHLDTEDILVPTLMLQPLAENAIWHGLLHKKGGKHLFIHFSKNNGKVNCIIEDNGIGINRSEQLKKVNRPTHKSVGLANLRNRIKILNEKYNSACTLEIMDLHVKGTHKYGTRAVLSFKNINH